MSDRSDNLEILLDTLDRLERNIDTQIDTLNGIDDKAQHISRLVTWILGLVLTVLSILAKTTEWTWSDATAPIQTAFILGTLGLLAALFFSIWTYLISKFKTGLHSNVGRFLGDAESDEFPEKFKHYKKAVAAYSYCMDTNTEVIDYNAQRFAFSMTSLFAGLTYIALSGIFFFFSWSNSTNWIVFGIVTVVLILVSYVTASMKYSFSRKP